MPTQNPLLRQIRLSRYMLLGTVIATVVNTALLLGNAEFFIPYCAALPYYLVWFGKAFDNGLALDGPVIAEFTHTGLLMCFVILVLWLVVWYFSRHSLAWLKAGMGLVIADTGLLGILVLLFFGNPISFFMEFVLHAVVIWEIWRGIKAFPHLAEQQMSRQVQEESLQA